MDRTRSDTAAPSPAANATRPDAPWDLIALAADARWLPVEPEPDRDRRPSWTADYDEVE